MRFKAISDFSQTQISFSWSASCSIRQYSHRYFAFTPFQPLITPDQLCEWDAHCEKSFIHLGLELALIVTRLVCLKYVIQITVPT